MVTFTEEIPSGKLPILCSVGYMYFYFGNHQHSRKVVKKTLPSRKFQNKYILGFRYIKKKQTDELCGGINPPTPYPPNNNVVKHSGVIF